MSKPITITRGQVALVDDEDYVWLSQWKWQAIPGKSGTMYAKRRGNVRKGDKAQTVLMHRVILNSPLGFDVDHINGNGLDNRRSNLRVVTTSQNLANRRRFKNNRSGYKGVVKNGDKWAMKFSLEFDTPEEAAEAYDRVARLFFGASARTNSHDNR